VAATVDGAEVDLDTELVDGTEVAVVTADSDAGREVLRHSTAHVMAQAVRRLWPGAKYAGSFSSRHQSGLVARAASRPLQGHQPGAAHSSPEGARPILKTTPFSVESERWFRWCFWCLT